MDGADIAESLAAAFGAGFGAGAPPGMPQVERALAGVVAAAAGARARRVRRADRDACAECGAEIELQTGEALVVCRGCGAAAPRQGGELATEAPTNHLRYEGRGGNALKGTLERTNTAPVVSHRDELRNELKAFDQRCVQRGGPGLPPEVLAGAARLMHGATRARRAGGPRQNARDQRRQKLVLACVWHAWRAAFVADRRLRWPDRAYAHAFAELPSRPGDPNCISEGEKILVQQTPGGFRPPVCPRQLALAVVACRLEREGGIAIGAALEARAAEVARLADELHICHSSVPASLVAGAVRFAAREAGRADVTTAAISAASDTRPHTIEGVHRVLSEYAEYLSEEGAAALRAGDDSDGEGA